MKTKILISGIFALILGTTIYLLFRTSTLKIFTWLEYLNINFLDSRIRNISINLIDIIPDWVLFSLPDGLWTFSYVCIMLFIWNLKITYKSIFWILLIPTIAIFSEIGQFFNMVQGTFDYLDLIFYFLGLITPFIYISTNQNFKIKTYEQKN